METTAKWTVMRPVMACIYKVAVGRKCWMITEAKENGKVSTVYRTEADKGRTFPEVCMVIL
jgi:hypothetical protein